MFFIGALLGLASSVTVPRPMPTVAGALEHARAEIECRLKPIMERCQRKKPLAGNRRASTGVASKKFSWVDTELLKEKHFVDPKWVTETTRKLLSLDKLPSPPFAGFRRQVASALGMSKAKRLLRHGRVEDLSGTWTLQERHNMESFLKTMGFNPIQRAAAIKAGQVQVIRRQGDFLHIVTRDVRGSFELVLPLNGPAVDEPVGDSIVSRRAWSDGGDIVITESLRDDRTTTPFAVCRRSIDTKGRMNIDVEKKAKSGEIARMRIVYTPIEGGGSNGPLAHAQVDEQENSA